MKNEKEKNYCLQLTDHNPFIFSSIKMKKKEQNPKKPRKEKNSVAPRCACTNRNDSISMPTQNAPKFSFVPFLWFELQAIGIVSSQWLSSFQKTGNFAKKFDEYRTPQKELNRKKNIAEAIAQKKNRYCYEHRDGCAIFKQKICFSFFFVFSREFELGRRRLYSKIA